MLRLHLVEQRLQLGLDLKHGVSWLHLRVFAVLRLRRQHAQGASLPCSEQLQAPPLGAWARSAAQAPRRPRTCRKTVTFLRLQRMYMLLLLIVRGCC